MSKQQPDAVIIVQSSFSFFHRKQRVEFVTKSRLRRMCERSTWTDDGCLVSYGLDLLYL